jgi:hypothetical protein
LAQFAASAASGPHTTPNESGIQDRLPTIYTPTDTNKPRSSTTIPDSLRNEISVTA